MSLSVGRADLLDTCLCVVKVALDHSAVIAFLLLFCFALSALFVDDDTHNDQEHDSDSRGNDNGSRGINSNARCIV